MWWSFLSGVMGDVREMVHGRAPLVVCYNPHQHPRPCFAFHRAKFNFRTNPSTYPLILL